MSMHSYCDPLVPAPHPLDHLVELASEPDSWKQPALVLRNQVLNYDQLRQRVARLAAWLQQRVPEKRARIASWAAKGELTCLLPLACARAGLIHVPINPLLKRAQVAHILADSGAALLVGTPTRLKSLGQNDVPAACETVSEAIALDGASTIATGLDARDADPDELAAILYTSGSTGRPKGVMLSHANLWLGAVSVADYLKLTKQDVTLAVLPLAFDYGQNQLLSTWYSGGSVVPLDFLFPRDVAKACKQYKVTTLAAVPPLWVQLTEIDWPTEAISTLRRLTNSGGALTRELVVDLQSLFPSADLYPMYGLTEAFRSTYLSPELVKKYPTSIGKAIPFAEILVMKTAELAAQPGEEGELVHCGPLVAQGYWRDPERTGARFRPAPSISEYGGTAVWSGDQVKRDDAGLLYFVGRKDAMIKSAGNRISPQEIEEAALATDLIAEAVALGVPHERLGQAVHLVVRAVDQDEKRDQFVRLLTRELPNFMHPEMIHWRSTMPLNPNGKIDRSALLRELTELTNG
ncbi:MAG: acyl-CoA ligase (AMP-forming), exosortase A system-associated [Pseudomonadota bacterium]